MNPLVIFGASTRAAAFSAIRAGFDPICGDMFADADLRAFATVLNVPHYPHGLAEAIQHLPPLPWLYTGALENSPIEVEGLSSRNTLWGNAGNSLKRCRDPWFCRDVLWQAGLPALELHPDSSPPPRGHSWLMKPLRSAAGRAITVWDNDSTALTEPHYFQQMAAGVSIAAAFLPTESSAHLLGISEQLIGRGELNAPAFGYCGSLFPWSGSNPQLEDLIRQIGIVIGRECGLRGLFGIDLICDGQTAWLIEVNPRYTASMELIEYQRQIPLLDWQQRACEEDFSSVSDLPESITPSSKAYCGKVVLYADRAARAPDLSAWVPNSITLADLPQLADIPVAGTEIYLGQPVFTCLGSGDDPQRLFEGLVQRSQELWSTFRSL
ncbi:MAG: ATP-grasp domain-containing protein [Planctomycetota bacterium]